jgi:ubiquinone/menaquinone biosynthesis C-methylase UbiE
MAQVLANKESLVVNFKTAPAENIPYPNNSFNAITANQCWLYFDKEKTIAEVKRLLLPGGVLMTSHFSWLPRLDRIAKQTEELILKYNPSWNGNDWHVDTYAPPKWSLKDFTIQAMFYYDESIPFTRETWRGRVRANRGIGATLSSEEVAAFDHEHGELLKKTVGETFTVLHRINAYIFQPH